MTLHTVGPKCEELSRLHSLCTESLCYKQKLASKQSAMYEHVDQLLVNELYQKVMDLMARYEMRKYSLRERISKLFTPNKSGKKEKQSKSRAPSLPALSFLKTPSADDIIEKVKPDPGKLMKRRISLNIFKLPSYADSKESKLYSPELSPEIVCPTNSSMKVCAVVHAVVLAARAIIVLCQACSLYVVDIT
ncbi:hypothetical protein EB796_021597 [Bugula neritina]|uniref:Uncharacterized protein n=1 Tax=Bugula neritina TaxID=10212 RepID=A0A7J7J1Q3_BUGNE|nr:hypothetical protein EB796_021597 [Bugula neritina]